MNITDQMVKELGEVAELFSQNNSDQLKKYVLSTEFYKKIADAEYISLECCLFDKPNKKPITTAVKIVTTFCPKVTKINLQDNHLAEEVVEIMSDIAASNIIDVNLRGNDIGDYFSQIASIIAKSDIQYCNFYYNQLNIIKTFNCTTAGEYLAGSKLKTLDLTENNLGDNLIEVTKFVEKITSNENLKTLKIGTNKLYQKSNVKDLHIGFNGLRDNAKEFVKIITGDNSNVEILNIRANAIYGKDMKEIAHMVGSSKITNFYIQESEYYLQPNDAEGIAKNLAQSKCLEMFTMRYSNIGHQCKQFAEAISGCSSLKELYLELNDLGKGALELVKTLASSNITTLDLNNNNIPGQVLIKIANFFVNNYTFPKYINLRVNKADYSEKTKIAEIFDKYNEQYEFTNNGEELIKLLLECDLVENVPDVLYELAGYCEQPILTFDV